MSGQLDPELAALAADKPTLVGIDSDGCVFDSMSVKQIQCFHPQILRHWNLYAAEKALREAAEFVNLYSRWRGSNRFPALLKTFELFAEHPGVHGADVTLPNVVSLRAYVGSGRPLSHAGLAAEVERTGDTELRRLLEWSADVNAEVERVVQDMPPFDGVRRALERMAGESELIVVSQTPEEALVREWRAQGLDSWVSVIAGQERGTKSEHLAQASAGRWPPEKVLLIGDAPGDLDAARQVGACFFPIDPGQEEGSWARLVEEAYDRFLQGRYRGDYEDSLVDRFLSLLPETPSWA